MAHTLLQQQIIDAVNQRVGQKFSAKQIKNDLVPKAHSKLMLFLKMGVVEGKIVQIGKKKGTTYFFNQQINTFPDIASRNVNRALLLELCAAYGLELKCQCCGETNLSKLELDDVDGEGAGAAVSKHYRNNKTAIGGGQRGKPLYNGLKKDNWPKYIVTEEGAVIYIKYQLLCSLCNRIKGAKPFSKTGGKCALFGTPHNETSEIMAIYNSKNNNE